MIKQGTDWEQARRERRPDRPDEVLRLWHLLVAADMFGSRALGGPDVEAEVYETHLSSGMLNEFGQEVGMCRWAQLFVLLVLLLQDWTSFLAVVMRLCVDEDILDVDKFH